MKSRQFLRASFFVPVLLVACESQEMKSLLERQDYFERQITIYEERVQKATQKLDSEEKELEEVSVRAQPAVKSVESRESMLAEIRDLISGLAEMESSMLEKAGLIESYKSKFTPRSIPNGTNLGDLTLVNGSAYKGVVVKDSTATHLNIGHSGGFSQIPYFELPDTIKAQFVFAPVEPAVIPNPRDVISRKPVSIKSAAEYVADQQRATNDQERARRELIAKGEEERAENLRKAEERKNERDKADAEYRIRLDAYMKEVNVLDTQISAIESQISSVERQKAEMEYANNLGTVRLARADFIKKLKPFDIKIQELNAQVADLRVKRSNLVMPTN